MDNRFGFLSSNQAGLLDEILRRRNPTFADLLEQTSSLRRSDADEIMRILSDEITDNLDDDWEPTDYGRAVSSLLAQFNTERINEWPT